MDLSLKKHIIFPKKKRLPSDIQLRFLKRLARLLKNGYPLLEALEIIKWDNKLASTSNSVIQLLKNGIPIDQALDKIKFHPDITSYLFFVRSSGDLESSIQKCIHIYEQRLNYLRKFKQTLRYPLILFTIFFILLIFLKYTVLPSFHDIFQMSDESSSTILISIVLIDTVSQAILYLSLFSGCLALLWHFLNWKVKIETKIKLYNAIPFYRHYVKLQTSFLFATHLSTLLKTGMSIKEILNVLAAQKKLPILSYYAEQMTYELSKGVYVTNLLTEMIFIDSQLSSIFQKNVDTNALERDLRAYADYLTEELHRKMMKVLTLIQPFFFIILASFIIFIYVTLMWPMFQLIKTI